MKKVTIKQEAYSVTIHLDTHELQIICKEVSLSSITYKLPEDAEIVLTNLEGEYLFIHFNDKTFYQLKFQLSHEIVLDHFTDRGDLVSDVGCCDFYD